MSGSIHSRVRSVTGFLTARANAWKGTVMHRVFTVFIATAFLGVALHAYGGRSEEVSLFDQRGRAIAYVADNLTIYLWSGKPVAYLKADRSGGFHVYGFNGSHLGWLVKGVVYDHDGAATGGVKDIFLQPVELEPLKSFKQIEPLKSLRELPPIRPILALQWSVTPLKLLLLEGAE
jgi:hypothetical protein